MNTNPYKYEYPGAGGAYYAPYQANDHLPRMDANRRAWEYSSTLEVEDPTSIDMQSVENVATGVHASPEEC